MARYRLCVCDDRLNKFYVLFSRDGTTIKDKVNLFEIDLLTVSLGKEEFITKLKKNNLAPQNFNWNYVTTYVEYIVNQETKYLPALFEKDSLLLYVLNLYNEYHYHRNMSENELLTYILKKPYQLSSDLKEFVSKMSSYKDLILKMVQENPYLLDDVNLSKQIRRKIYSCLQSKYYDERREYENDIVKDMLSYSQFRRMKAMEYNCHISDLLVNIESNHVLDENEVDPDEEAFLAEEEKRQMYG